jgi:hypothetical protein
MIKTKPILFALLIGAVALQSCKDDEDPKFQVATPTLDVANYTGTGSPQLLYSTDGGATFSPTLPANLGNGTKVLVKINNGTEDLTDDDFTFDWSGSNPDPSNPTADVAEFTISGGNLSIDVSIEELWALITSHRQNGKFYTLNTTTGAKTEAFTPTYEAATLNEIRAFTYHPKKKLFYASVSSYINDEQAGFLYSINPSTDVATRINENDGANGHEIWDAIVNWVVAPDDSLLAVGDFNDEGNGIVKFGTDGARGNGTTQVDFCCGLGLVWENATEILVGNGWNQNDGEIILEAYDLDGNLTDDQSITTFEGFPEGVDFTTIWSPMRALAKDKDGTLYGLIFDDSNKVTYFVKVDRTAEKIIFLSKLGENGSNQFTSLTFVPKHTL